MQDRHTSQEAHCVHVKAIYPIHPELLGLKHLSLRKLMGMALIGVLHRDFVHVNVFVDGLKVTR